MWPVRGGGVTGLLSLYRKNYVANGIVFMLHNYATRDQRIGGCAGVVGMKGVGTRRVSARGKRGGEREEKKPPGRGKVFRWLARPTNRPTDRPTTRLMNRNNSRAIVLFGSFQLTVTTPSTFPRCFCAILRGALPRIPFSRMDVL